MNIFFRAVFWILFCVPSSVWALDFGEARLPRPSGLSGDQPVLVVMNKYADTCFRMIPTPSDGPCASFSDPPVSPATVMDLLDGPRGLDNYIDENSGGRAGIDLVGVVETSHPLTRSCAHRYDFCPVAQEINLPGPSTGSPLQATHITIDHRDRVWGIGPDGYVVRQTMGGVYQLVSHLEAIDIDAGPNGTIAVVQINTLTPGVGNVRFSRGAGFRQVNNASGPGVVQARRVAVDQDQRVWTINPSRELTRFDGVVFNEVSDASGAPVPVLVDEVDIAVDGTVFARQAGSTGNVLRLGEDGVFEILGQSGTTRIATDANSNVWAIDSVGQIKIHDRLDNGWSAWGPEAIDLGINRDGSAVYVGVAAGAAPSRIVGPVSRFARRVGEQGDYTLAYKEILESIDESTFDFGPYDVNGDGEIQNDELNIIFLEALDDMGPGEPYGNNNGRKTFLSECAEANASGLSPKKFCDQYAFVHVGNKTGFDTVTHELLHLYGAKDLYGAGFRMSLGMTVMGATVGALALPTVNPVNPAIDGHRFFHLDPWHKLKFGWFMPSDATGDLITIDPSMIPRTVDLFPASKPMDYNPIVFYDPARGEHEYFIMEYRRPEGADEDVVGNGNGVAIWYVNTDENHMSFDLPTASGNPGQGDASVYHYGAPPSQRIGGNQVWKEDHGIVTLAWRDGTDTGLRFRVDRIQTGADGHAVVEFGGTPLVCDEPLGNCTETVNLRTFDWHCPTVVIGDGDREFNGNGPTLTAEADLWRKVDGSSLLAEVQLTAIETNENGSDGSFTTGSWIEEVYVPPAGWEIGPGFQSDTSGTGGESEDGPSVVFEEPVIHSFPPGGGNLVSQFFIVGDTYDTDISEDEDCNDDTSIKVQFNHKTLELVPASP